jgi:hypothetical protein
MCYREWTGAEMFMEQTTQVAAGHTKPPGQMFYVTIVQCTIGNEAQSTANCC